MTAADKNLRLLLKSDERQMRDRNRTNKIFAWKERHAKLKAFGPWLTIETYSDLNVCFTLNQINTVENLYFHTRFFNEMQVPLN